MKIALIATLYPPYILGGAEHSTALLAKQWQAMGHEVLVITTALSDMHEVMDGVRVERIANKNIYWRFPQRDKPILRKALWHAVDTYNPFYRKALTHLLLEFRPDVVTTGNLCGISVTVWQTCNRLNIPIVHTLRDYYMLCPRQTMSKHNSACAKQCTVCKIYSRNKKRLSRYVNAVVGISQSILDRHMAYGYFPATLERTVIPNSVPRITSHARTEQNAIGYMGRISQEKGIELLIEAYLHSEIADTHILRIAGNGNQEYMHPLVQHYGSDRVQFVGQQDANSFLSSIDLLVVPSLWNEPFGRVVIEAYAAHCPVFLSNKGALPELQEDGISWMFEVEHPESLTTLFNQFARHELTVQPQKFEAALDRYDEQTVAQQYITLFQKMIQHEQN